MDQTQPQARQQTLCVDTVLSLCAASGTLSGARAAPTAAAAAAATICDVARTLLSRHLARTAITALTNGFPG